MNDAKDSTAKVPSLADYLVRHDLMTLLAEARLDYNQAAAGTPRLLNQKDIAARFRKRPASAKAGTP